MHAVLTPVGADVYAVPVGWVRQVLAAPQVTPLVTSPPSIIGLFNLRGEIVPVLDTAALLGIGSVGEVSHVVVLDTPHGPAALAATDVPQRTVLPEPTAGAELSGTTASYVLDGRVVVALNPEVLLAPERFGTGPLGRGVAPAEGE